MSELNHELGIIALDASNDGVFETKEEALQWLEVRKRAYTGYKKVLITYRTNTEEQEIVEPQWVKVTYTELNKFYKENAIYPEKDYKYEFLDDMMRDGRLKLNDNEFWILK